MIFHLLAGFTKGIRPRQLPRSHKIHAWAVHHASRQRPLHVFIVYDPNQEALSRIRSHPGRTSQYAQPSLWLLWCGVHQEERKGATWKKVQKPEIELFGAYESCWITFFSFQEFWVFCVLQSKWDCQEWTQCQTKNYLFQAIWTCQLTYKFSFFSAPLLILEGSRRYGIVVFIRLNKRKKKNHVYSLCIWFSLEIIILQQYKAASDLKKYIRILSYM